MSEKPGLDGAINAVANSYKVTFDAGYTAGAKAERALWEAEVADWLEAYPEDIFVPPLKYEWKMAAEVLKTKGMTLDAISADNMRLVLTRLPERVERRRVEGEEVDGE